MAFLGATAHTHERYLQAEKKSHRTVKHIYFLPTLKATAQKNKRAYPSPPPPINNFFLEFGIFPYIC
jgi:hypothetical protein